VQFEGLRSDAADTLDCLAVLLELSPRRGRERALALLAACDLAELARIAEEELERRLGLPPAAAARLSSAFALGRRAERMMRPRRRSVSSARAVYDELRGLCARAEQESFFALLLDGKHRLIATRLVSLGTLTASLVHPREVFGPALRAAAGALLVAHNHPSGDPEPSPEDIEVTRRLVEVGRLVGIPLIDHVIVAEAGFVSLRERLDFEPLIRKP
jgi:DNA repair protein RadC